MGPADGDTTTAIDPPPTHRATAEIDADLDQLGKASPTKRDSVKSGKQRGRSPWRSVMVCPKRQGMAAVRLHRNTISAREDLGEQPRVDTSPLAASLIDR